MKAFKKFISTPLFLPLLVIILALLSLSLTADHSGNAVLQDDLKISIVETEPITYIGLEAEVDPSNSEEIAETMRTLYGKLMEFSETSGTETIGAPIAIYKSFGRDEIELICGLPVNEGYIIDHESIAVGNTLGGKAVKATHKGDYDKLPFTHDKVNAYIEDNNLRIVGHPYEIYVKGPTQSTDTSEWVTEIYYPLGR